VTTTDVAIDAIDFAMIEVLSAFSKFTLHHISLGEKSSRLRSSSSSKKRHA
jgi:hypothetical protein